jgi:hypothetical protein
MAANFATMFFSKDVTKMQKNWNISIVFIAAGMDTIREPDVFCSGGSSPLDLLFLVLHFCQF